MKVYRVPHNELTFEPVSIQITLETREELKALKAVSGWSGKVADVVCHAEDSARGVTIDKGIITTIMANIWHIVGKL